MKLFGKKEIKGDEVRVFKIYTDHDVNILKAFTHNNKLEIDSTDEAFKIPDMCSHFFWKEKGMIKEKIFKCYMVVNDIPIVIDYKKFLTKKDGFKKGAEMVYDPEEIKAFMKTKVISDFMNFKAGVKAWLIVVCIAGGAVFGFAITMLLRGMGYL